MGARGHRRGHRPGRQPGAARGGHRRGRGGAGRPFRRGPARRRRSGPDRGPDGARARLRRRPGRPGPGPRGPHGVARVLHAGGDATGAALASVLTAAVRRSPVTVLEQATVTDLILDRGHVAGATVLAGGFRRDVLADAVVLATGGAGQLFRHTTNPDGATADGVALAARAGAVLADLEFLQFHPTALAVPGTPLVSEAVRGAGAVLLDGGGRRFMVDVHPSAELAPRDVVARAIADRMARQGGEPVLLDARGVPDLASRFPTIDASVCAAGLDWSREPIPVAPAAHYWMGGVAVDADGRTSVPGLWAVGEVARTGVHGANRLASNSLLEALVTADRSGRAIVHDGGHAWPVTNGPSVTGGRVETVDLDASGATPHPEPVPPFSRTALQDLLWTHAGLARDDEGLRRAAAVLTAWRAAGPSPATPLAHEDANLLLAGSLLVHAARARTESRGAHARRDHPAVDPRQASSRFLRLPVAPVVDTPVIDPVPAAAGTSAPVDGPPLLPVPVPVPGGTPWL
ncbi:FAD-binding protein [Tersicoccus sp. MR15.9]|uniref:L-aspartate oxidase n=1 Tax=Tersicoccus mangrovi TaxID=3121635 RepID=UPI002FE6C0DF